LPRSYRHASSLVPFPSASIRRSNAQA
jgi:hypothetical protein